MPLRTEMHCVDVVVANGRGAMKPERLLTTPPSDIAEVFAAIPSLRHWIDPQMSAIYVISNEANSLLKIGYADNLKHRFHGLDCGSPVPLHLLHFVFLVGKLVAKTVEKQVHEVLADRRRKGEWFEVRLEEAAAAISSVVTRRKLQWWTEVERRALGKAARERDISRNLGEPSFFLRN